MTAVVSVPWAQARLAGQLLSDGGSLPTLEAPEVDRVYFLVPVAIGHDHWPFLPSDDFEAQYFWTPEEAQAWGERDVERRLEEVTA
jgi:hypothetical protein